MLARVLWMPLQALETLEVSLCDFDSKLKFFVSPCEIELSRNPEPSTIDSRRVNMLLLRSLGWMMGPSKLIELINDLTSFLSSLMTVLFNFSFFGWEVVDEGLLLTLIQLRWR